MSKYDKPDDGKKPKNRSLKRKKNGEKENEHKDKSKEKSKEDKPEGDYKSKYWESRFSGREINVRT